MASRKLLLGAGALAMCAGFAACSDRDTKVVTPAAPPVSTTVPPANTAAPTTPTDPAVAASNTTQMAGTPPSADFEQVRQQLAAISAKVSELEQKFGAGGGAAASSGPSSGGSSSSSPGASSTPPSASAVGSSTGMTTSSAGGSVSGGTGSSAGGSPAGDEITRLKLELDVLRQRLSEVEQRQRAIGTAASK